MSLRPTDETHVTVPITTSVQVDRYESLRITFQRSGPTAPWAAVFEVAACKEVNGVPVEVSRSTYAIPAELMIPILGVPGDPTKARGHDLDNAFMAALVATGQLPPGTLS